MLEQDKVNILLVDDQPGKLLAYEAILGDLGENLLKASSGRGALEHLLKSEVAVVLIDVCMPDLDGFQLAAMIREHPRFQKTAMIFISAIHLTEMDRLRGYEMGAVDYVPVPVIPQVLRAKVKIFAELYRKTRQLECINAELEQRVSARTAELEASTLRLQQSEERRSMALASGNMGSWDWDLDLRDCHWDDGQYRIFGVQRDSFTVTPASVRALIHPDDWISLQHGLDRLTRDRVPIQQEFRIRRANGEIRWCTGTAAPSFDHLGNVARISGVTLDITDRKHAEERQALLAREVDHRAKNALALVQSIIRLTQADNIANYVEAIEGRIRALSRAHTLLSQSRWQGASIRTLVEDELSPYQSDVEAKVSANGPDVSLNPAAAQTLGLALHELVTNAVKYGALSSRSGLVRLTWKLNSETLAITWTEHGGPKVSAPFSPGFGMRIIKASIEGQLGGAAAFTWRTEGLKCVLSVPRNEAVLGSSSESEIRSRAYTEDDINSIRARIVATKVLVVEDEALVAMSLSASLSQMGISVVGPFSRVPDAVVALTDERVDAAILDVNLGGDMVYPLAEILSARNIPFVFVTGYSQEEIDVCFRDVPVLQKPIERGVLMEMFSCFKQEDGAFVAPRGSIRSVG